MSFDIAPTVVAGGADEPTDVDIFGRLGTSELHDASSNIKVIKSRTRIIHLRRK